MHYLEEIFNLKTLFLKSSLINISQTQMLFKPLHSAFLILPSDPDAPPRDMNVTLTSTGLRIVWDAPAILSGPTSYLVQVISFFLFIFLQTQLFSEQVNMVLRCFLKQQ